MLRSISAILSIILLGGTMVAQTNKTSQFERTVLYEGELTFTPDSTPLKIPLLVEDIIIDGGQTSVSLDFPFEGLMLVQLRGGELVTYDSNEKKERQVNEFWTVRPEQQLGLTTEDDSAILRIYLLEKSYLQLVDSKSLISDYKRYNQEYKRLSGNLFARTTAIIGAEDDPIAKIVDLNLGPGKVIEGESFNGPAFLQVLSTNKTLLVNGSKVEKILGQTLTLAEGESLRLNNEESDTPARIRAVIFMK